MMNFVAFFRRAVLFCAFSSLIFGGQTRTWTEDDYASFQKGVLKNLSLRSDGVLTLAPRFHEYYDTSAMYLWSIARDSKGDLYTGGGSSAKLYRIGTDGKGKVLAELDGLEIHAIAVDSKDRVYAATAPDGKVYRVSANGKAEVYYDPKTKYIWALAFDRQDNLFVATGDPGEIHRVTPDGKGKVFFHCDETHVRSVAIDPNGNVIVGTSPSGLVLRVSPAGEGFVLYQTAKQEVTAVALGTDGAIYAAAVGSRQQNPVVPQPQAAPAPTPTQLTVTLGGAPAALRPATPPAVNAAPIRIVGGSDVYRIDSATGPHRVWTSGQDIVYAITFDSTGRVILGAGNRGNVYRIDSPTTYTNLVTLPVTQVTAFQSGTNGRLYAVTGNIGKVYEIDSTLEPQGSIESDVFDAGLYTQWGRVSFRAELNGGRVAVQTRTGNLDQAEKNWSPWADASNSPKGERASSPSARFVQWRATLTAAGASSPQLESVPVAYLPKNVEPRVDQIEITSANYKFPAPSGSSKSDTLSLPPLTARPQRNEPRSTTVTEAPATTTSAMQPAKGYLGARWVAWDPNDDTLIYTVEIRGANETEWKPLKDKLTEKYVSWDSTAFPDGEYRLRVTASDALSNPPGQVLTASLVSEPLLIDNTPPKISGLTATRNAGQLQIHWHAADALSNLAQAEFSVDGGDWTIVAPVGGLSDSMELDYDVRVNAGPGEHTIAVRVQDDFENQSSDKVVIR
jgi:hypothetical protein